MMLLTSDPALMAVLLVMIPVLILSVKYRKLTLPASIAALLTGLSIAFGTGLIGVILLLTFFLLGVLATSHRKDLKAKLSPSEEHHTGRTVGQVFANGGVAAIVSAIAIFDPTRKDLYLLMLAASLASALADTTSSELGIVYGRNFYNILTFKRDTRGLDGVVSLEGTLIGAAGAAIIAIIYKGISPLSLIVLLSGIAGNFMDSLLGAAVERKGLMGNNAVNFCNTLFAALAAGALALLNYE